MRLVHEKKPVACPVEESTEMDDRVKQIIVVADDNIAPFAQVKPHLKRADLEPLCCPGQGASGKTAVAVQQCRQRILDALIVAVGVGAGFRQAGRMPFFILAQAGFLFGRQGHTPERQFRRRTPQTGNGVFGGGLGRVARGEVE